MIRIIRILTFLFIISQSVQAGSVFGKSPSSLEDTYVILNKHLNDSLKAQLKNSAEAVATARLYFISGIWVGRTFDLWTNSKLKSYFISKGVLHPYYMIDIIITYYYRRLNNLPLEESQLFDIYQDGNHGTQILKNGSIFFPEDFMTLTNKLTTEQLNTYFKSGDTVLVNEINRLSNSTPTALPSLSVAIVRNVNATKIEIEIIVSSIRKKDHKPPNEPIYQAGGKQFTSFVYDVERVKGYKYDESPENCGFYKPKGLVIN